MIKLKKETRVIFKILNAIEVKKRINKVKILANQYFFSSGRYSLLLIFDVISDKKMFPPCIYIALTSTR